MGARGMALSTGTVPDELTLTDTRHGYARVSEIQRKRMLAGMVELCAERGVANVTVAHVVERSGVSRRTFYELFADREDCFVAAFDDAIARAARHVLDGYDPDAKWVERIRSTLVGTLSFFDMERDLGRLVVVSSPGGGRAALERRKLVLDRVIALVEEGRQVKDGPPPSPLAAEGVVGGVLSVIHARMQDPEPVQLTGLTGPLMAMIVLPYLGSAGARRELARPAPPPAAPVKQVSADPLRDVGMRLTYRTMRVLMAVGAHPDSSNREIGAAAGMVDQGQISRLLTRLAKLGLIENNWTGRVRGAPNAWTLTPKGAEIEHATSVAGQERYPAEADHAGV